MKYVMIFIGIFSIFCWADSNSLINKKVQESLNSDELSPSFKYSLKSVYEKGPNFNLNDYVIVFSCGGPATCISILNSENSNFIYFPFPIIGYVNFDIKTNKICLNGINALDSEKYNNDCYRFVAGEIIDNKK